MDSDTPAYRKGLAAKLSVESRFKDNNGKMLLNSEKRGKWRRWLAWIVLPDRQVPLNRELVHSDLAVWSGRSSTPRLTINLEPDLYTRLTDRARTLDLTPATLAHTAITEYLDDDQAALS